MMIGDWIVSYQRPWPTRNVKKTQETYTTDPHRIVHVLIYRHKFQPILLLHVYIQLWTNFSPINVLTNLLVNYLRRLMSNIDFKTTSIWLLQCINIMKIISKVTLSQQPAIPPPPPPHWTQNSFVTFKKGMGFIKKNSHGWVFCNRKCLFLLKINNSY